MTRAELIAQLKTLVLEATLTDVFSVVFALVILQFIQNNTVDAGAAAASTLSGVWRHRSRAPLPGRASPPS